MAINRLGELNSCDGSTDHACFCSQRCEQIEVEVGAQTRRSQLPKRRPFKVQTIDLPERNIKFETISSPAARTCSTQPMQMRAPKRPAIIMSNAERYKFRGVIFRAVAIRSFVFVALDCVGSIPSTHLQPGCIFAIRFNLFQIFTSTALLCSDGLRKTGFFRSFCQENCAFSQKDPRQNSGQNRHARANRAARMDHPLDQAASLSLSCESVEVLSANASQCRLRPLTRESPDSGSSIIDEWCDAGRAP